MGLAEMATIGNVYIQYGLRLGTLDSVPDSHCTENQFCAMGQCNRSLVITRLVLGQMRYRFDEQNTVRRRFEGIC